MKFFAKFRIAVACFLMCLFMGACGDNTKIVLTTGFQENEIFRIDDLSCYTQEILVYMTNIQNQYSAIYGEQIWNTDMNGVSMAENVRQTVLARIAKIKMMNLLAQNYNLTLDEEELELAQDAASAYYESLSDAEIQALGGIDEEMICEMYEEYALAEKVYEYLIADVNPEISDDEARTITLRQIVLYTADTDASGNLVFYSQAEQQAVYEDAVEIAERAAEGESFDELVQTYSDMDNALYSYRKGEMDALLEEAAFNLAEGEISGVLQGTDGYYILLCVNPFDREQTQITKAEMLEEQRKAVFDEVYSCFMAQKRCYLNEELWATIGFVGGGEVDTADFFDIYSQHFN